MQSIQITGTYTFSHNVKKIKLGDVIVLKLDDKNKFNTESIGAYTSYNSKIGYIPLKKNQLDINKKYIVSKINLNQKNPIIQISTTFNDSNFLQIQEKTSKFLTQNDFDPELLKDLKIFGKYLEKSGISVSNIKIGYTDENFIDIIICTDKTEQPFNTVTKKYYEENIFKYDEFYKFGLIPWSIYIQFQIHRLEVYLEKNYKLIDEHNIQSKLKLDNLINQNVFDMFNTFLSDNFGFDKLEEPTLKLNNFKLGSDNKSNTKVDYTKLLYKYTVAKSDYWNPLAISQININIEPVNEFIELYSNVKVGGLAYNHKVKAYCTIDLYDDENIIEITDKSNLNKSLVNNLLLKLVISDKKIINIFNPFEGILWTLEIPPFVKERITNIWL